MKHCANCCKHICTTDVDKCWKPSLCPLFKLQPRLHVRNITDVVKQIPLTEQMLLMDTRWFLLLNSSVGIAKILGSSPQNLVLWTDCPSESINTEWQKILILRLRLKYLKIQKLKAQVKAQKYYRQNILVVAKALSIQNGYFHSVILLQILCYLSTIIDVLI